MAEEDKSISLIPKEGEKIKIENIFSKIGIVLIVLIILAAGIYGGLFFYNEKLNQQILAIKGQIEELDKNRNPEFENRVILLERKLLALKEVLNKHFFWSNLLSKIEKLAVPQIIFTGLEAEANEDGSLRAVLSGISPGYTYLAKQFVSFSNDQSVSKINIPGISLSPEGGLEFDIYLDFKNGFLIQKLEE